VLPAAQVFFAALGELSSRFASFAIWPAGFNRKCQTPPADSEESSAFSCDIDGFVPCSLP
jgi:hypothetical protein